MARFRLFRILTSINLFIAGFFLMCALGGLAGGQLMGSLLLALFSGAVFIHCVLSASLQRSLMDPGFTLKESTPGGIRIMGWIATIYAFLLLLSAVVFFQQKQEIIKALLDTVPQDKDTPKLDPKTWDSFFTSLIIFIAIYGVMIVINSRLSFGFLKEWERRQQPNDEDIL
jgi:NADH:ubiquinone oxidoreductase subunit 6 (subunit J)